MEPNWVTFSKIENLSEEMHETCCSVKYEDLGNK